MDQRLKPPFFDRAALEGDLGALWRKHDGNSAALRSELLAMLKQLVREAREAAWNALEADGNGRKCAESLSLFQDELIKLLFDFITRHIYRAQNPFRPSA